MLTGSVGLLGDAIHNLSDVSTSAVVFLGFRLSRRPPTERYPYGLERAEDLAGIGIAVVIWASAAFAGRRASASCSSTATPTHVGAGIAGAAIGIAGNQAVARYKLRRRQAHQLGHADRRRPAFLAGRAVLGRGAGRAGRGGGRASPGATRWPGSRSPRSSATSAGRSPRDVVHRLADGVDPGVITTAEAAAGSRARRAARSRPGPLDGTDAAGGDRGLGGRRPARPRRRRHRPAGRRRPRPAAPRGGQLHLDQPRRTQLTTPPRRPPGRGGLSGRPGRSPAPPAARRPR